MNRRDFLRGLAVATPTVLLDCSGSETKHSDRLGEILPQRILGGTGEAVTMLGVGGYHIGWTTEKDAEATIEAALEGGVRFFDSAESYSDGRSETRYGKYLTPRHRDLVFLMTKTTSRTAAAAEKHLDESLKRLKTDYLDLWQVHSLQDPDDVDQRIENGVLDVFLKARDSGKARYIGFTGHRNPAAHARMLERTAGGHLFDTCQMPVNVLDPSRLSFIETVLPTLRERKIALLAMKTLADGRFFALKKKLNEIQWESDDPVVPKRISLDDALYFSWSLPISVLITGAENAALMREKVRLARSFLEIGAERRDQLVRRVADLAQQGEVEYFKRELL